MMGMARAVMDAAGTARERVATGAAADDELVAAMAAGDRHALELLYRPPRALAVRAAGDQDLLPRPG
jgi:hypothetical protein